jgi:hypothetical protein
VISPAARRALTGVPLPPALVEGRIISNDSAPELIDLLIRFNLEALQAASSRQDRQDL